ncbi:hypothetical protein HY641_04150 [Candidatus Woesearchaeota archaeon]|nr:hypothetical protein [Candidatus Woesearchaeota archaeon]
MKRLMTLFSFTLLMMILLAGCTSTPGSNPPWSQRSLDKATGLQIANTDASDIQVNTPESTLDVRGNIQILPSSRRRTEYGLNVPQGIKTGSLVVSGGPVDIIGATTIQAPPGAEFGLMVPGRFRTNVVHTSELCLQNGCRQDWPIGNGTQGNFFDSLSANNLKTGSLVVSGGPVNISGGPVEISGVTTIRALPGVEYGLSVLSKVKTAGLVTSELCLQNGCKKEWPAEVNREVFPSGTVVFTNQPTCPAGWNLAYVQTFFPGMPPYSCTKR